MKIIKLNENILPKEVKTPSTSEVELNVPTATAIIEEEQNKANYEKVIKERSNAEVIKSDEPKLPFHNEFTVKPGVVVEKLILNEEVYPDDIFEFAQNIADTLYDFNSRLGANVSDYVLSTYGLDKLDIVIKALEKFIKDKPNVEAKYNNELYGESLKEAVDYETEIDDEKYIYYIYMPEDPGTYKIPRVLTNMFEGTVSTKKGFSCYLAPDFETADEALEYARETWPNVKFEMDKITRKERKKSRFDLSTDIWTEIYDKLTRTYKDAPKAAGYDYGKALTTDTNGNIWALGRTAEDLQPAIDVAEKFKDRGVTYRVDPFKVHQGSLTHVVVINVPEVPEQELPDNRVGKINKNDQRY